MLCRKFTQSHAEKWTAVLALGCLLVLGLSLVAGAQTRDQKVREDRIKIEKEGYWVYNNWPAALAKAKETGKPLLVVLRCLPCTECVKLDDDLLEKDPVVRPLMDKFVCVRLVSTNGLDLSLFQFDTDQSFAVFFLNADQTIYGRFGTRSHRTEWLGDVSLAGMAAAMQGALELHAAYPANRESLSGKRGPQPEIRTPEKFPSLQGKYTDALNYEGNVVQSCIHCHQIGDAQRELLRSKNRPLPESLVFPYPHPKSIGLVLEPDRRATVKAVLERSPAAAAGFQPGDEIKSLDGQPLLSMADVQWVLQQASPAGATLVANVRRGDQDRELELELKAGWRQSGDLSWRSSSWGVRRMVTGGILLEPATEEQRKAARVADGEMALFCKHVGQYGPHAAAKNAGFQQGDILISFDGRKDLLREADLFFHALSKRQVGDQVPVTVWREGKKYLDLKLPMQP